MWEHDEDFVAWMDREGLGTDAHPLDDDVITLMYGAWRGGRDFATSPEPSPFWGSDPDQTD